MTDFKELGILQAPEWFIEIISTEVNFYGFMETLLDYFLIEANIKGFRLIPNSEAAKKKCFTSA